MAGPADWTPAQKVLYTSLVPIGLIAGAALLIVSMKANGRAPEPKATPAAARQAPTALDARDAVREQFRQCLRDLDADFGGSRFRGRFSPRPNVKKLREAYAICQTVLEGDGTRPSKPRAPAPPPIA